jgi:hypothetical protein
MDEDRLLDEPRLRREAYVAVEAGNNSGFAVAE